MPTTCDTDTPTLRYGRMIRSLLHQLGRLTLLLVMLAYVPLLLAVTSAAVYGAYRFTVHTFTGLHVTWVRAGGAILLDLAAAGIASVLLVVLIPLLFREAEDALDGTPLEPKHHPALFALIDRFCKRLNVKPPDAVYLSPFETVGIQDVTIDADDGRGPTTMRTLCLGAAMIVHLRVDEFETILCHELAHAAAGDTRFDRMTSRFFESMKDAVSSDTQGGGRSLLDSIAGVVLVAYYRVFVLFYAIDSRWREFRADRIAAAVCGPHNLRNALVKTHLTSFLPDLTVEALYQEMSRTDEQIENIYHEHRARWHAISPMQLDDAKTRMFVERNSIWATHPCLTARVRNLRPIEAEDLVDDRPATSLFGNWTEIERDITQNLIAWGRAAHRKHIDALDQQLREM